MWKKYENINKTSSIKWKYYFCRETGLEIKIKFKNEKLIVFKIIAMYFPKMLKLKTKSYQNYKSLEKITMRKDMSNM